MLILPCPARSSFAPARFARIITLLAAPLLLSACATGSYPSLAKRAGEAQPSLSPEAAPEPTPAPPQADLSPQLAAWSADARAADARFAAALPAAQRALAAPVAPGTDAWSAANMALAEVERARNALGTVQAAVEAAYAQDRIAHAGSAGPDGAPALAAIRDTITAMATAQDMALAPLRARLLP